MKRVIQIVLTVAIVVLGYMLVESIMAPIRFQEEQSRRYDRTIERLRNIRTAQLAYRSAHGEFTGSFDTLIDFVLNDSFSVVRQIGDPDDEDAVERGDVYRDTVKVSVRDSIFRPGFDVEQLRYVPFTDREEEFELGAGEVKTGSGLEVKVFEARVHNDVLLHGLDRQQVINLNDQRRRRDQFPGLKVGDLERPTNHAGNWE